MNRPGPLELLALQTLRGAASLTAPSGRRSRLSILIYHRVLPERDAMLQGEVDAHDFDLQMRTLSQAFNVLPLAEAVERLKKNSLPARAACITFDDGYADNEAVALPILQRYKLPATFFIATGYLNGGRMWNDTVTETIRRIPGDMIDLTIIGLSSYPIATIVQRRHVVREVIMKLKHLNPDERQKQVDRLSAYAQATLPENLMMTSDQVRRLYQAGMEIGGHTLTHPILKSTALEIARHEIETGKEMLEEIIKAPLRIFAYPNGKPNTDYAAEHVKLVKKLGFTSAVSTAWGTATADSDIYQLPRFTPWDKTPVKFLSRLIQNQLRPTAEIV